MQHEGKPQFIHAHKGIAKGVAFSPRDRYVFCSGGTDGKVNVYNALQGQHTLSVKISTPSAMKFINAVKFNADGSKILLTTARRLSVIDAERGEILSFYENCAYSSTKDRAPLATDPYDPNMVVCCCSTGRGLVTVDLRTPQPTHFAPNLHSTAIKDIIYLDQSWPYGDTHQATIASLSLDGICKIRTTDNTIIDVFDVKHRSNCITATPDVYSMFAQEGFESLLMIGGDGLTEYSPPMTRLAESRMRFHGPLEETIYKLKYTSNGHLLYSMSSGGHLRRYRRLGKTHQMLGVVYTHEDDIFDMDISPNDEYIVTASRDGTVGILCLGAPSHGWTSYMVLA